MMDLVFLATLLTGAATATTPSPTEFNSPPRDFDQALERGIPPSDDPSYGLSDAFPIKVGDLLTDKPDERARRNRTFYLLSLRGPDGQPVHYRRRGMCGMYEDATVRGVMGELGGGVLDCYEVWYEGSKSRVVLYLDVYRFESPQIPRGFTFERTQPRNWRKWIHEK